MRYFLIMNPGARGGASRKRFERIFALLKEAGVEFTFRVTDSLDDAYQLSRQANEAGYEVIVAVGGDGTLNKVLNGFYTSEGKRCSDAKFGVIYTGTSPDFCKSYGIPLDLAEAVRVLVKGTSSPIQVGMVTLAMEWHEAYEGLGVPDSAFSPLFITRYFACCANIGLGATLARNANSGIRKWVGDYPGTFLALLKTLAVYRVCDYTICRDGVVENLAKVHTISVGRTYYIASGIKVKTDLHAQDQRMYNLIIQNMRLKHLPQVFRQIYSGRAIMQNDVVSLKYSQCIEIYGNKQNPEVEFDGDPGGYLPCRIKLATDPLDLIR